MHFVGGAAFGSAPQLCYDELLSALAKRKGVAVRSSTREASKARWMATLPNTSSPFRRRCLCIPCIRVGSAGSSKTAQTFNMADPSEEGVEVDLLPL